MSVLIPVTDTGKPNQTQGKRGRKGGEVGIQKAHTHTQSYTPSKGKQLLASSSPPNMSVNLSECGGC